MNLKSSCATCALNIKGTCRAMPPQIVAEVFQTVERGKGTIFHNAWPLISRPDGWCSWHTFSLWKFLRGGAGA